MLRVNAGQNVWCWDNVQFYHLSLRLLLVIIQGCACFTRHHWKSPAGLMRAFIIIQPVGSCIHFVFDWLICLLPGNLVERKSKIKVVEQIFKSLSTSGCFISLCFTKKKECKTWRQLGSESIIGPTCWDPCTETPKKK